MLAEATGCALSACKGGFTEADLDISSGLPAFNIVGLLDTAVQEARERVRAAIRLAGQVASAEPERRARINGLSRRERVGACRFHGRGEPDAHRLTVGPSIRIIVRWCWHSNAFRKSANKIVSHLGPRRNRTMLKTRAYAF